MSWHAHAHTGSHFSPGTPTTFLATNHTKDSNLLQATEDVGHNLVDATIGTSRRYIADILNQFRVAGKIAMTTHRQSLTQLPKNILWIITNTGKAFTNAITGIPHAIDRVVTKWLNNSVVDVSSGTTDNIPLLWKPIGNLAKFWSGILNAPTRFLSWLTKIGPDALINAINNRVSSIKPTQHLEYAKWNAWSGHWGAHH